ncbi:MAG TPA: hypothetical protein VFO98_13515 [Marmoricola sp.]|jgi:hypothetical protein|nr:hypothetical protein [Marmoricola sp.]
MLRLSEMSLRSKVLGGAATGVLLISGAGVAGAVSADDNAPHHRPIPTVSLVDNHGGPLHDVGDDHGDDRDGELRHGADDGPLHDAGDDHGAFSGHDSGHDGSDD